MIYNFAMYNPVVPAIRANFRVIALYRRLKYFLPFLIL